MGFTKQTNAFANNPVIISDVLDVFCRHVDDMSTYGSLALAVNDFQRIYNFKDKNLSLKGEIEAHTVRLHRVISQNLCVL